MMRFSLTYITGGMSVYWCILLLSKHSILLVKAFSPSTPCSRPLLSPLTSSLLQASTSTTTRSSKDATQDPDLSSVVPSHRTLYDVLGASPTDPRDELKKRYVALAKQSHPDALSGSNGTGGSGNGNDSNTADFSEIAAAWRVLADPTQRRRYDRSLQAEQFSAEVEVWAGHLGRGAAGLGNFAMPFLRKAGVTTLASIQAAASDLSSKEQHEKTNVGGTFKTAMEAARKAGRFVDSMEFYEKSEALESRAMLESEEASKIQEELETLARRSLELALHTPGSGLTAAEAQAVWEEMYATGTVEDTVSLWDRATKKRSVEYEVQELQGIEVSFVETQKADTQAQNEYQELVQARLKAKKQLIAAEKQEEETRRIYEMAEQRAMDARNELDTVTRGLAQAEAEAMRSDFEMERKSLALVKQSEKVRSALRQKERESYKTLGRTDMVGMDIEDDMVSPELLRELKELRRQERILQQNMNRLEDSATRHFSRAQKLRTRAEELDRLEG